MQDPTFRRFLSVTGLVVLGLGLVSLYYLSGFLIYGGRFPGNYYRELEPQCNSWHEGEIFADHRLPREEPRPIKLRTCAEAIKLPKESVWVDTREGLKARLVLPDGLESHPEGPIWLHVHGITDSYLNGLRFYETAHRLGFKQILLEMQNHGGSSRHNQGSSWGCRERWDIIAAIEYINSKFPDRPVLLSATSMGTISSTEALLTRPDSFRAVKGVIYESALSSFDNLLQRLCLKNDNRSSCENFWRQLLLGFASLRSDVNFSSCHLPDSEKTAIPTRLWLSREEYTSQALMEVAAALPRHTQVTRTYFPRGSHSAYYSYQAEEVEADLVDFWQSLSQTTVKKP